MKQNESQGNRKTKVNSSSNISSKIKKIVTFGRLDIELYLKLSETFLNQQKISFDSIETPSDLGFLSNNKEIWKDIILRSNNENLNFMIQINKSTMQKTFVSYVCLTKLELAEELKFINEIITYVTEKNWIFLNFEDVSMDCLNILFTIENENENEKKIIKIVEGNKNKSDSSTKRFEEEEECDNKDNDQRKTKTNITKSNNSSNEEENEENKKNILKQINPKQYEDFNYIYFNLKSYTEEDLNNIITIQNLGNFYTELKEKYQIDIITNFPNILPSITTAKHVFSLEKILLQTDIFLFEKKDAYSIFNFLHIIQHKDDNLAMNNTIANKNENSKNTLGTNSNKLNSSQSRSSIQGSITISNLDKKKMFSYFSNEIIALCPYIYNQKIALFMDEFNKATIHHYNSSKNTAQTYEYDTLIYPKINHYNIEIVNQYKNIVESNYDNFLLIFFGSFIGKIIQEIGEASMKSIYLSYLTAIESSKKILEIKKNNLQIPNNPKFFIVKLPENTISAYLKEQAMKQKENKFTLDCLNKKRSQLKFYNPLFDYHLNAYFNSHFNQKVLRTKGFINNKGYIMYDAVYRDILGTSPKRKKKSEITDKTLLNYINHINIGRNINNKEIDVLDNVLKRTTSINKKLPHCTSERATNTLYNGQINNKNFSKTVKNGGMAKLPPIKKDKTIGNSFSMNNIHSKKYLNNTGKFSFEKPPNNNTEKKKLENKNETIEDKKEVNTKEMETNNKKNKEELNDSYIKNIEEPEITDKKENKK